MSKLPLKDFQVEYPKEYHLEVYNNKTRKYEKGCFLLKNGDPLYLPSRKMADCFAKSLQKQCAKHEKIVVVEKVFFNRTVLAND